MKPSVLSVLILSWIQLAAAQDLPLISQEQLTPGSHWTWTYYTQGDLKQVYSAERYEVISKTGSVVSFEIKSRYNDQGEFTAHTRFKVDWKKCLHAFDDPETKHEFEIELYALGADGQWPSTPYAMEATAFEEKFNCNPILHNRHNSLYETRFETLDTPWGLAEQLFQQWPKAPQNQLRSYYFTDLPGLQGVAYRKEFNPGTPAYYRMQMTDWGKAADSEIRP